jgi:hypothetical protein
MTGPAAQPTIRCPAVRRWPRFAALPRALAVTVLAFAMAAGSLVGGPQPAQTAQAAQPAQAAPPPAAAGSPMAAVTAGQHGGACKQGEGVTVVVQGGNHSGGTVRCAVGTAANALAATAAAGFSYEFVATQPGFVCRIDGFPEPCADTPPDKQYWSLWTGKGGAWSYATTRAGALRTPVDTIVGWNFGATSPPAVGVPTLAPAAPPATTAPPPTKPPGSSSGTGHPTPPGGTSGPGNTAGSAGEAGADQSEAPDDANAQAGATPQPTATTDSTNRPTSPGTSSPSGGIGNQQGGQAGNRSPGAGPTLIAIGIIVLAAAAGAAVQWRRRRGA